MRGGENKDNLTREGESGPQGTSVLHCLECGADLPSDAQSCPHCGNERLILPGRWSPPGDERSMDEPRTGRFNSDIRILVGMTLALVVALGILGSARGRTNARLAGEVNQGAVRIETSQINDELEIQGAPIDDIQFNDIDVEKIREQARLSEMNNAWLDAANTWMLVTLSDQVIVSDYLALGNAWEKAGDMTAASSALNMAIVKFPENPLGYAALGELNERQGNLNAARFQYEIGLSYQPDNSMLMAGLARTEEKLGYLDTMPVPQDDFQFPLVPYERDSDEMFQEVVSEVIGMEEYEERKQTFGGPVFVDPSQPDSPGPGPQIVTPENLLNDDAAPVTLIGLNGGTEETDGTAEPDGTDIADTITEDNEGTVEIRDITLSATTNKVTVQIFSNEPPEFSTSSATEPKRLILRLQNSVFAPGSRILRNINVNVPVVDRVTIVENEPDNKVIVLVLYLGEDTRYTVTGESGVLKVILESDTQ